MRREFPPEDAAVHRSHKEAREAPDMPQLINHEIRDDLVGLLDASGCEWVAGAVGGVGDQAGEVEQHPQDP